MRKIIAIVGLVIGLAACTPQQIANWNRLTPEQKVAFSQDVMRLPEGRHVPCEQWLGTSRVAGFTDAQILTEHVLMFRESRCDPHAYNRSGASGLMQVMRMWADDCGGTPALLFDPQFNLDCAKHVFDVQWWTAWSTFR